MAVECGCDREVPRFSSMVCSRTTDRSITSGGSVAGRRNMAPATNAATRATEAMESARFIGRPKGLAVAA